MKWFAVAQKELLQSFRSLFALFFMFVVPLAMTGLFYVMFGGGGDEGFTLPQTTVIVVNMDAPLAGDVAFALPENVAGISSESSSMGELLLGILRDDGFAELLSVSLMRDAAAARRAVDESEAGVALIIPANFTAALLGGRESAALELYQDPTLTIGPAIVGGIVSGVIDQLVAGQIGIGVTVEQLAQAGVPIDAALIEEVVAAHIEPPGDGPSAVLLRSPASEGDAATNNDNQIGAMLGLFLGGMMVFFAFFTGSATLQSILTEDEKGTLARLFSTPTSHLAILGGKYGAALLLLVVQVVVLVALGALAFRIYWGTLPAVILAGLGLVVCAATTGLFLVSMMKNSRQGGIVFGGVLTLTGMIGMLPVFTISAPGTSDLVDKVALLVPQGWAVRGFAQAMSGADIGAIALNTAGLFLWSLVFALIAQYRLKHRFDR